MLKKLFTLLILCLVAFPVALGLTQDDPPPPVRIEITGIDPTNLPTVIVTASVTNALGQPILGLGQDNFSATVEGADGAVPEARIVSVENVADDSIPFSVVLMIDISTSMDVTPIAEAQAAARVFVNSIGDNDSVALMTFGSTTQLVQDFTTDKDLLISAIDSLQVGGQTALYQGGYDAVQQALNSPTERRVVILLSDGAEFGDHSEVGRGDALQQATINGVPVYTIGLGFGTDRSFLESLATGTNAQFFESPNEEQLTEIYRDLAALLRSQYIITMEIPISADGQTYDVNVTVNTNAGESTATGTLRAPIPVPLIIVPDAGDAIAEPTDLTFTVFADDALTNVTIAQDGGTLLSEDNPAGENGEYSFTIPVDPRQLPPGSYTVDIAATDETADVGTASYTYEIAALPSTIVVSGLPAEGTELSEPTQVQVLVEYSQAPTTETTVTVNGETVQTEGDQTSQTFTVDPYALQAGENIISVTTTNNAGTVTTVDTTVVAAAMPPITTLDGLEQGDEITEETFVTPSFVSQAPIVHVAWFLDGAELAHQLSEPFGVTLDPLTLASGQHTLTVAPQDANGTTSSLEVTFSVPLSVAQTATALAPTATPAPSNTPTPSETPQPSPTANITQTQNAENTSVAQLAADERATNDAAEGTATAEANTQGTLEAENVLATANAQATTDAQSAQMTATALADEAIAAATSTAATQRAITIQGTANALSTSDAENLAATEAAIASATAQSTSNAQATTDAQGTADAAGTNDASVNGTATAIVANATQTAAAQTTGQAVADAASAQQTATAVIQAATQTAASSAQTDADLQLTATAVIQAVTQTSVALTGEAGGLDSAQMTATAIIAGATQTIEAEQANFGTATSFALTEAASITPTRQPAPTLTPAGELTEVEAQGAPQNTLFTPLIVGCGLGILLLLIIFFLLNRRRTRKPSQ